MGNLIGNAIKYTPAHGNIIAGHAEEWSDYHSGHRQWPQIPQRTNRIFSINSTAPATCTHGYPGTGLGLAIVKSIVDNHLGRIWVDLVVGRVHVHGGTAGHGTRGIVKEIV
jgi:signal transduction histidine kinase